MAVTETGHAASREVDELYRRHGSEVYRYAFAVLGNHADAEDVTQTTFLNAYRALEQGVRPRKASNWLLAIASNAIKQRFRAEQRRPRYVELDDRTAGAEIDDPEGPTVGELLSALSKIPPQQRQAIVLREFEGRSYAEIADILGVTTSALETLLFRARRSLAEELEHQLTCTEAQLAISRAADGRLGRKERRRLRDHLGECPDCARFASVQQRHRRALKGLMLLPVPLSLHFVKGLEGTATAATLPVSTGAVAASTAATLPVSTGAVAASTGVGAATTGGVGVFAGGAAAKAAAVVVAATMAGGVVVSGASESSVKHGTRPQANTSKPGARLGQVAPRGVIVPGNGVARGKARAPGQSKRAHAIAPRSADPRVHTPPSAAAHGKSSGAAHGQRVRNGTKATAGKPPPPGSNRAEHTSAKTSSNVAKEPKAPPRTDQVAKAAPSSTSTSTAAATSTNSSGATSTHGAGNGGHGHQ